MKVMIAVTHLLGTGHLARALVLGRAFAAAGHRVSIVSGGMPVPHLDTGGVGFERLPGLRSDGVNFTRLLDENGAVASPEYLEARKRQLIAHLDAMRPDVLVTELFPFGRRVLAGEFGALLSSAWHHRPRPLVAASIRDILAPPSKPERAEATLAIIAAHYDTVLVHADPSVVSLDASWPVTPDLAARLHYTGFVAADPAAVPSDGAGAGEVLVTTGGGAVGRHLFETALAAARRVPRHDWRLLVGGAEAGSTIAALAAGAPARVAVVRATPAFRGMLRHAAASVSLCGYNTALDVLQAGVPAVFVPFDEGGETEQTLRAVALSRLPGIVHLPAGRLDPDALNAALAEACAAPRRDPHAIATDGAERTVRIVEKLRAEMPA